MAGWKAAAGPVVLSAALVVATGVVHGWATDRWGPSEQLQRSVAALDRVPAAYGDWAGEEVQQDPEEMARAGIRGWVYRNYRNARAGESVSVLVVCGRGGPISVHTPDVCYAGAGFQQVGEAVVQQLPVGETTHVFRTARFARPGGVSQGQLEVYWAWSPDGRNWEAPESARLSFGRCQALYKLYVVREFLPGNRTESVDACQTFLRRALPDLCASLNPDG